jgi:hypothetical protein
MAGVQRQLQKKEKERKNVVNVAFECIRYVYIYKADHPGGGRLR